MQTRPQSHTNITWKSVLHFSCGTDIRYCIPFRQSGHIGRRTEGCWRGWSSMTKLPCRTGGSATGSLSHRRLRLRAAAGDLSRVDLTDCRVKIFGGKGQKTTQAEGPAVDQPWPSLPPTSLCFTTPRRMSRSGHRHWGVASVLAGCICEKRGRALQP